MPLEPNGAGSFDVLIVGAGPAGSAIASALRQAGVQRVGMLNAPERQSWRACESAAPDVPALLARTGLAMPPGHRPYDGNIAIWNAPPHQHDFRHRGHAAGYLLDRILFDRQLRDAAVAGGVTLIPCARLRQAEFNSDGWRVRLHRRTSAPAEQILHARLLVDASGRRAVLARALGAVRRRIDRQVALIATVAADRERPPHAALNGRVLVETLPVGWIYATLQEDGQLQLGLVTDQDLARTLRRPHAWRQILADTVLSQWLPGAFSAAPVIHSVAADSACLDRAAGPGWLAVGDALMSLDPLTSSGVSGALRDAVDATRDVLLPWLGGGSSPEPGRRWGQRANRSWLRFMRGQRRMHAQGPVDSGSVYWQRRFVSLQRTQ
jgi:flavin-dependent dehydrogenase